MLLSLDLFSGVGGMTLALHGIAEPVAYCEIDRHAQHVLMARMQDGSLPMAPIYDDVRTLTQQELSSTHIDIIVGGWPCQDLSPFGLRKGLQSGTRSGLVSEVSLLKKIKKKLADELKPKAIFLENVPAILGNGMDQLIREFVRKRGYEMRWAVIPASSWGHHTREAGFSAF